MPIIGGRTASVRGLGFQGAGAPGAPTNVVASNQTSSTVDVSWTAPPSNGASITSYTVVSNPGNVTAATSTTSVTVTGLSSGVSYTFTVTATNSVGTGQASSASNSVTTPGSIQEFTSSTTFTPPYYPYTFDVYAIGGAAGDGGSGDSYTLGTNTKNEETYAIGSVAQGGGGGSGYFSAVTSQTVTSGTLTITIGAVGANGASQSNQFNSGIGGTGSAGGFSRVVQNANSATLVNANGGSPGNGGSVINNFAPFGAVNPGNAGAGGSAGGGYDSYNYNGRFGASTVNSAGYAPGWAGSANSSQGGNDNRVPPGSGGVNPGANHGGIVIGNTAYGVNRGSGSYPSKNSKVAGYVLIVPK